MIFTNSIISKGRQIVIIITISYYYFTISYCITSYYYFNSIVTDGVTAWPHEDLHLIKL